MPARDDEKRSAFALAYATCGNASEAARQAGVPSASAHSMGYRWLRAKDVQLIIRMEQDRALRGMAGAALSVIAQMLNDQEQPAYVRLAAAREVLDRSGFAKPKRRELPETADVARSPREMSVDELRAMVLSNAAKGSACIAGANEWDDGEDGV